MPKELIVSVNGREKKIAIIEDGRVTEFYIERGEGGQGIVGNIYKGRVMRVLPGMQSAFVDIGLERDAFLYVSDFFDEEEEFERIVVDRSAKGEGAEAAARAARERIEQQRVERERALESAQELALPAAQAEGDDAEDEEGDEPAEAAPAAPAERGAAGRGAGSIIGTLAACRLLTNRSRRPKPRPPRPPRPPNPHPPSTRTRTTARSRACCARSTATSGSASRPSSSG